MSSKIKKDKAIYLAGFLDGDGSVYVQAKRNNTYRFGYQIEPAIVFFQSAKVRIKFEEIMSLLPYGKMRERSDGILEYRISRIQDLIHLIKAIQPYIVLKKEQIKLLKDILVLKERKINTEKEFNELLCLVDEFRNLNYSKRRLKRVITP